METYKVKSITISKKPGETKDSFKTAFIGLFDENNPPPGLLEVAQQQGRSDFKNCVVFHSLSKRSNAPGLRSGFVAGDAEVIKQFLRLPEKVVGFIKFVFHPDMPLYGRIYNNYLFDRRWGFGC